MSSFVDACRREWRRIGVPEAVSNEMAADLEADLAEAEADGVSPEGVVGNGYFAPASFAASWASARGFEPPDPRPGETPARRRPWAYVTGAVASAVVALVGVVLMAGARRSSVSVSVSGVAFHHPLLPSVPGAFAGPHGLLPMQPGKAIVLLGLVLLIVGLVGLGVTFCLWKLRNRPGKAGPGYGSDVGMPTYL